MSTMHAIDIQDDTATWITTPKPAPGGGEVLVRIHATAVNRADLVQRAGFYNPPQGASQILGLECAGVIEGVGDGVDQEMLGKRVCALLTGGGYAEYTNVPATQVLELPRGLSFTDAAAIPEVFLTAFINLFIEAELQPGESALIHAAASGVGTAALQLCQGRNPVVAVCDGKKHDAIAQYEPAVLVDRHHESFVDAVKSFGGVDVILDPVGGANLAANISCLNKRGRLVNIGLLGGVSGELDMRTLLVNRLRVIGSVLRARSVEEKARLVDAFRTQFWHRFPHELHPVIETTMPIQEMDRAHELLATNTTVGKIVLIVD